MTVTPKHIHFMGIAGSGMSAVAQIAAAQGYQISGCDLNLDSPYLSHVKSTVKDLHLYSGHSPDHLKNIDLLCVTPAIFYQNNTHPEIEQARAQGILSKWQDFLGTHLHRNKYLICVAGTHGKSTTTAMVGLLLEKANFDPTVEIGATVKDWHNNVRIGKSKYFVSEADEFHDNFATYMSDVIILTLVEYDHPEYFGSYDHMLESYLKFLGHLKPNGTIIYNADSPGCVQLINAFKPANPANLIPYHLNQFPINLNLSQPGDHNKLNAMAIIKLGQLLKIPNSIVTKTLKQFLGLERRLDLLGEKNGIKVYDDYANHPSSYKATIQAIKQQNPHSKIIAVIEPHTFSRLRSLLSELPDAVNQADEVIVSKIFASREQDPGDFTGADIVAAMRHPNAQYIPEFTQVIQTVRLQAKPQTIILVMGSGNSYKLSRDILANL